jgi:signal transduction histidine kinase
LPPDFEKHAFDRFYRGDDARSRAVDGLGLGLSLCKEIATLHEAQLYAKVKDDGIVTFTLTNSHLQPI